jgi:ubiquinone/menaquinone biosynthesis C-methylase UbiE
VTDEELLEEQIAYYRARAPEYDHWWLRWGRYALPSEQRDLWFTEVGRLEGHLDHFGPRGEVLELACGTGLWTSRLVGHAQHVTAVDTSPEVLARNRSRLSEAERSKVDFVEADVFAWEPERRYHVVLFAFWLSHVPPSRFEAFWSMVERALVPGGRVFLIDNRADASTDPRVTSSRRQVSDGREFTIVKVFYEPGELAARLEALGWDVTVTVTGPSFIVGWGGRRMRP